MDSESQIPSERNGIRSANEKKEHPKRKYRGEKKQDDKRTTGGIGRGNAQNTKKTRHTDKEKVVGER
jgi:hypothetical protein